MSRQYSQQLFLFCFLIVGLSPLACKQQPPAPPAAGVSVAKPLSQEVTHYDEYSGHLESPQVVNLAAQVSGVVMKAPFTEGALAKAGDVLFIIDDRPFKAEVERAQAQATVAEAQLKRFESVKDTQAVSKQDYDQALAQAEQSRAQLTIARLNLEWTRVTAPIDGRVGRKLVTEGNLVIKEVGLATPLTSITSIDPIYAYVNVPERSFLQYQALAKAANDPSLREYNLPCAVQLENETNYPHSGTIDFIDNHVDPSTGTIEMRGIIPNHDGSLTPGLFAKMRIQANRPFTALLVPDSAIGSDQNNKYVLTVGADKVVKSHTVKLGPLVGKLRVIAEGVSKDDLIIVNGLQSARVGTAVSPTEVALAPDGSIAPLTALTSTGPDTAAVADARTGPERREAR